MIVGDDPVLYQVYPNLSSCEEKTIISDSHYVIQDAIGSKIFTSKPYTKNTIYYVSLCNRFAYSDSLTMTYCSGINLVHFFNDFRAIKPTNYGFYIITLIDGTILSYTTGIEKLIFAREHPDLTYLNLLDSKLSECLIHEGDNKYINCKYKRIRIGKINNQDYKIIQETLIETFYFYSVVMENELLDNLKGNTINIQ